MKTNKHLLWLKANAKYLSIKLIEEEIGCPNTTIQQFVGKAERSIPVKWQQLIIDWVKRFKK